MVLYKINFFIKKRIFNYYLKMGNSPNKTLIIWIDKNVNNNENISYQKTIEKEDEIKLKCFEEINQGIECIKEIKFQKTIIIISGSFYKEFFNLFERCVDDINIIPKIIIFTGNLNNFNSYNFDKTHFNHPFYNIGGVVDDIDTLMEFIKKSINKYNSEFDGDNKKRIKNEELIFQSILNKNELVLPIYYGKYLKNVSEEEIDNFNKKIFKDYESINNEPTGFIFSQLSEAGNIPIKLLTKFWLRAYSLQTFFTDNMNKNLINNNYNDYLPIIHQLYKAANECFFDDRHSKLYKGIIVRKGNITDDGNNCWKSYINKFKEKENNDNNDDIPKAILYGTSFFSFYKDEDIVDDFKKEKYINPRNTFFIKLILENNNDLAFVKNSININKELSYFEKDDEVLFFPFSCFEIKKIEETRKDLEYKITLNYLDKYKTLFQREKNLNLEDLPKNNYLDLILNSGIIDQDLIKKNGLLKQTNHDDNANQTINLEEEENQGISIYNKNSNNSLQSDTQISFNDFNDIKNNQSKVNLNIIKEINDKNLLKNVHDLCINTINNYKFNNYDELRNLIQDNLEEKLKGNWWVNVGDKLLSNNGNIDYKSIMIFQNNKDYFIHVASL